VYFEDGVATVYIFEPLDFRWTMPQECDERKKSRKKRNSPTRIADMFSLGTA
jgi:hypothetical protein